MALFRSAVAVAVAVAFLSVCTTGFMQTPNVGLRTRSSLSMSAALIVQNKGGGHGELGKIFEL